MMRCDCKNNEFILIICGYKIEFDTFFKNKKKFEWYRENCP